MKNGKINICVIGTGYVGLVSGACLAELGHNVACVDSDRNKIKLLRKGVMPIYEKGLEKLVHKNVKKKRLSFANSIKEGLNTRGDMARAVFIAVGTPPRDDSSADLSAVEKVAQEVAENMTGYTVIVEKSTVPVETCMWIEKTVNRFNKKNIPFDVASNPEFLREGTAVHDFLNPDRVVLGVSSARAEAVLRKIYEPLKKAKILVTGVKSAELIKHASNSFLSTKISFINAVANICERTGANIDDIAEGMGLDKRIGPAFLKAGIGFGGFCLHPEEPVIVRDPSGKVRILPINKVYEEIKISNGLWESLSFNSGENKIHFQPITAVSKRPYNGNLLKIKTKMGKQVIVTEEHPILIREDSFWQIKLAHKITLRDWMPMFLYIPATPRYIKIDLINSIKTKPPSFFSNIKVRPRIKKRWILNSKARQKLISLTDGNHGRVHDIAVRGNPMSMLEFMRLEEEGLLNNYPHEKLELGTAKGNATYVPAIIGISDGFCRFLGYLATEGCICRDNGNRGVRERITIHFHELEEEFINDVENILKEMGIRFTNIHVPRHHTKRIIISSRIFAYFLQSILNCGKDSYTPSVSDTVLTSPVSARKAFLEGVYRGDGSVYYHKHSPAVSYDFGTANKNMAVQMTALSHSIGVVPSHKIAWQNKSTMPAHFLRISGASQICFLNNIKGIQHKSKILKRPNLLKRNIAPTGYKIISPQVGAVRITSIEKLPYNGFVYSMEIEGWETFSSGSGLILHNCFPKDLEAFYWLSRQKGYDFKLLKTVKEINEEQKKWVLKKVGEELWNLSGKTVAVLGLAFKPNTDDMRFAPSVDIINELKKSGAKVKACDPVAGANARKILKGITFCKNPYDCVKNADCVCLLTEWDEFKKLDFKKVNSLVKHPVLIDGRNLYKPAKMRKLGFTYHSVGRP